MISLLTQTPRPFLTRRDVFAGIILALATALVLGDAWSSIIRLGWNHEELGYVILAPLMIGGLLWIRRDLFAHCRAQGEWLGISILIAGLASYWYGYNTDPVIWRGGAVLAVVGAVITALGRDFFWKFSPAIAACIFLIPVSPNGRFRLAIPLQTATAHATQSVCDLIGIDVERAGSTLSINGVDVAVVEACNGMRMVITLFLVCYVVAFAVPLRWWVRVLLLAASPLVAIVCNVVRLVPTVWLFGHASRDTAERFHDFSGWAMCLIAFGILMVFCWILHRLTTPFTTASESSPAPTTAPSTASLQSTKKSLQTASL